MQYRTLFISDLHLGKRASKAHMILDFLKENEFENIYIVGDFIDCWAIKRSWNWDDSHNILIQKLLRKHRKGVKITWIIGNHESPLEQFIGTSFGGIPLVERCIHVTADGAKLVIIHGHQVDIATKYAKWLSYLGDIGYEFMLSLNTVFNKFRNILGLKYWSLSDFAKRNIKEVINIASNYENCIVQIAKDEEAQGVICGHLHISNLEVKNGIIYGNTGDFVESITCIIEHMDGSLELLKHNSGKFVSVVKKKPCTKLLKNVGQLV